jgi:hypothetical protein
MELFVGGGQVAADVTTPLMATGAMPPKRLYSKDNGYLGSTVLQPASSAERKVGEAI